MGIQLSDEEVWEFVGRSHTGILTTLRRDGRAVALPLWFASFDGAVWFTTPARSKKVARIRRDQRACFLVESGLAWRELKAVMMDGNVAIVEEESTIEQVGRTLDEKYRAFRPDLGRAPDSTRKHYTSGSATLRFTPTSWISWDNAKIRFGKRPETSSAEEKPT